MQKFAWYAQIKDMRPEWNESGLSNRLFLSTKIVFEGKDGYAVESSSKVDMK